MSTCDRCGSNTDVTTTSYFNTETLCMSCATAERAHPSFERARAEETAACMRGDYNFPGIGCPPELRVRFHHE